MKILLAEDEPLMAAAIQTRLALDGYEVVEVKDGREALSRIKDVLPDLVITDIFMPLTSGLELVAIIKSTPDLKDIPVIVLSGMGQEDTVLEAFDLGADDFLTKPFNSLELSTRIKRLLNKKKVS